MTHTAPAQRLYAWLPPILNRAAEHGCLDEDVETGDPVVCEDCYTPRPTLDDLLARRPELADMASPGAWVAAAIREGA